MNDLDFQIMTQELRDPKYNGRGASRIYAEWFHRTCPKTGKLMAAIVFDRAACRVLREKAKLPRMLPSDPDFQPVAVTTDDFGNAWVRAGRKLNRVIRVPEKAQVACPTCIAPAKMKTFWTPLDPGDPGGSALMPAFWCGYCGTILAHEGDKLVAFRPDLANDLPELRERRQAAVKKVFEGVDG